MPFSRSQPIDIHFWKTLQNEHVIFEGPKCIFIFEWYPGIENERIHCLRPQTMNIHFLSDIRKWIFNVWVISGNWKMNIHFSSDIRKLKNNIHFGVIFGNWTNNNIHLLSDIRKSKNWIFICWVIFGNWKHKYSLFEWYSEIGTSDYSLVEWYSEVEQMNIHFLSDIRKLKKWTFTCWVVSGNWTKLIFLFLWYSEIEQVDIHFLSDIRKLKNEHSLVEWYPEIEQVKTHFLRLQTMSIHIWTCFSPCKEIRFWIQSMYIYMYIVATIISYSCSNNIQFHIIVCNSTNNIQSLLTRRCGRRSGRGGWQRPRLIYPCTSPAGVLVCQHPTSWSVPVRHLVNWRVACLRDMTHSIVLVAISGLIIHVID